MGHGEVLHEWGKTSPPLGFDPRTVQPVARRHTYRPIPVRINSPKYLKLSRKWLLYTPLPVTFTNSILPTQRLHVFPITATINININ